MVPNTENQSEGEQSPQTQPAMAGMPPRPPKKTARDLEDPGLEKMHIFIPDPISLRDLLNAMSMDTGVIRLIQLSLEQSRSQWSIYSMLDFKSAEEIARARGYVAHKLQ